ncbi:MAG: hypothetical protein QW261_15450 [Candidatus Jordarchaeaceae archaeon]
MRYPECGMEGDRDVIAARNLLLKYNNIERCDCSQPFTGVKASP